MYLKECTQSALWQLKNHQRFKNYQKMFENGVFHMHVVRFCAWNGEIDRSFWVWIKCFLNSGQRKYWVEKTPSLRIFRQKSHLKRRIFNRETMNYLSILGFAQSISKTQLAEVWLTKRERLKNLPKNLDGGWSQPIHTFWHRHVSVVFWEIW